MPPELESKGQFDYVVFDLPTGTVAVILGIPSGISTKACVIRYKHSMACMFLALVLAHIRAIGGNNPSDDRCCDQRRDKRFSWFLPWPGLRFSQPRPQVRANLEWRLWRDQREAELTHRRLPYVPAPRCDLTLMATPALKGR
jgi:hypothetical protein